MILVGRHDCLINTKPQFTQYVESWYQILRRGALLMIWTLNKLAAGVWENFGKWFCDFASQIWLVDKYKNPNLPNRIMPMIWTSNKLAAGVEKTLESGAWVMLVGNPLQGPWLNNASCRHLPQTKLFIIITWLFYRILLPSWHSFSMMNSESKTKIS